MPVPPLLSDICYRIYEKEHLAIVMNLKRDLKIGLGCHVWAEHTVPLLLHTTRDASQDLCLNFSASQHKDSPCVSDRPWHVQVIEFFCSWRIAD